MEGLDAIIAELSGEKKTEPNSVSAAASASSSKQASQPPVLSVSKHASHDGVRELTAATGSVPPNQHLRQNQDNSREVRNSSPTAGRTAQLMTRSFSSALKERVKYFERRLRDFAMHLADPVSRSRVNLALGGERFDSFVKYYRDRPALAAYSIKQDLQRLDYTVVPHGRE